MTAADKASYNRTLAWNFTAIPAQSFDNFGTCMDAIISGN